MRRRFDMRVYGYVAMPEHVHLLLSEPEHSTLAEAMHYLTLSFAKRLRSRKIGAPSSPLRWANLGSGKQGSFWQKRHYDRQVRDAREFGVEFATFTGIP